jgi:hypothetical protein
MIRFRFKLLLLILLSSQLVGCQFDNFRNLHDRNGVFSFDSKPTRHVSAITLVWLPYYERGDNGVLLWKAVAKSPVSTDGLTFRLFEPPAGFRTTFETAEPIRRGGYYRLSVYEGGEAPLALIVPPSRREVVAAVRRRANSGVGNSDASRRYRNR